MRTARRPRFGAGRLGHAASPPARALDRPRNDVLEPAKDGAAPAGRLIGAKAIVGVDVVPAPRARLAVQQIDAEKVVRSRRARGDLSQPYAETQRQCGLRRGDRAASRDQSPSRGPGRRARRRGAGGRERARVRGWPDRIGSGADVGCPVPPTASAAETETPPAATALRAATTRPAAEVSRVG